MEPRAEDEKTAMMRRMAESAGKSYLDAFKAEVERMRAGGETDDEALRQLSMLEALSQGYEGRLPRNNLELRLHPKEVTEDWFWQVYREAKVADREKEYVEAQWSLDFFHRCLAGNGGQHTEWDAKRSETSRKRDAALEKLIHTPALKLDHVKMKQQMLGRAEWAREYRPALQAVIDEEVARLTAEKEQRKAEREARKARRLAGEV
jgi:hypothetical protein